MLGDVNSCCGFEMKPFFYALVIFVMAFIVPARAEFTSSDPNSVCNWLGGSGLATKGWERFADTEHYSCNSHDLMIGNDDSSFQLNNLVYVAEGSKTTVEEVRLRLDNYFRWGPSGESEAKAVLLKAVRVLAEKASGKPLPDSIAQAVNEGLYWSQQLGRTRVKVVREDWSTGKGYSIKVTLE
jgi:hypothetical protein